MRSISIKPIAKFLKNPPIVSNLMKEHIRSGKTLIDSKFEKGSPKYLKLFREARDLYSKGVINISNPQDLNLVKNTKIGEIIEYKGLKTPLDFPITENLQQYIYTLNPVDKSLIKVIINESYGERLFQVEVQLIINKDLRDIKDVLSNIRAIEGITIVNIEDVDEYWSKKNQHNIKIKIKIDPTSIKKVNKSIFNKILRKIKIIPGVLRVKYISKIKVI